MKTSLSVWLSGKIPPGMIKSLGAIHQRITAISTHNALPNEMCPNGLSYEASSAYRDMKRELEYARTMAIVEAQRQTSRG